MVLPTLHVIVPNIRSRSGHNYQITVNACTEARQRGWGTAVHLPRGVCDPAMVEELEALCDIEHCTRTVFEDPMLEIGAANQRVYEELLAILRDVEPEDLIYLT